MGHLKKVATGRFGKIIFFLLKGDPYSNAKTITSGADAILVMVKVFRFLAN